MRFQIHNLVLYLIEPLTSVVFIIYLLLLLLLLLLFIYFIKL